MANVPIIAPLQAQFEEVLSLFRAEIIGSGDMKLVERLARKAQTIENLVGLSNRAVSEVTSDLPLELQDKVNKVLGIRQVKKPSTSPRTRTSTSSEEQKCILRTIAVMARDGADLGGWGKLQTGAAFDIVSKQYPGVTPRQVASNVKTVRTRGWQAILGEESNAEGNRHDGGQQEGQLGPPAPGTSAT